jgi:hypothetical protein
LNFDGTTGKNGLTTRKTFGIHPDRLIIQSFSTKSFGIRHLGIDRVSKSSLSLPKEKISRSGIVDEVVTSENHKASKKFLSVLTRTGKLSNHKRTLQLPGSRALYRAKEMTRFSQAKRLLLFQTLSKVALPFLDLHVRFGVSKQTIRNFVRRGLIIEVWGPKAVGLRFKLSKKGKKQLEELEAGAKYDSHMSRKGMIRLKRTIF